MTPDRSLHERPVRAVARRATASGTLDDASVRLRVRHLVMGQMHQGLPTMGTAALELGVSKRTLRRHLEDEGTTFQAEVDALRLAVAQAELVDGTASVTEVAFRVGFSDVTAFHRAFRRWTGTTPAAYRAIRRPTDAL